ncbi:MAG: hypothetical protein AAF576_05980, partial [Pseudomonadota bacterium]
AGHGAQVTALGGDEPDGLDEVFLPVDARLAPDGYQNLIRDDEIGARIDAMVARGAHVWLIADTCHAGSLRRSDGENRTARLAQLAPASAARETAPLGQLVDAPAGDSSGSFVGFYAARPGALAFEFHEPGTGETHGLLTWAVASVLSDGAAGSYADIARRVTAKLWQAGRVEADPEFAGSMGRAVPWTGQAVQAAGVQFRDELLTLDRGRLAGFSPGAVVSVEGPDGALFEVAVAEAGLTEARAPLPPVPALTALDAAIAREGLDPARFRTRWLADRAEGLSARRVAAPVELAVTVGLSDTALSRPEAPQVTALIENLAPALRLDEVAPDLWIDWEAERFFLTPTPPGAREAMATDLDGLPGLLRRAAKARALLTLPDALGASGLEARIEISQREFTEDGACGEAVGPRPASGGGRPPLVSHCDRVTLILTNSGAVDVDVTPLYLAPDFQTYFLAGYEGAAQGGWRVPAGGTSTLSYTEATRDGAGRPLATGPMHLLLLTVPAAPDGPPTDFRYLEERAPPPLTRAPGRHPMAALFDAAGFGLAFTRSIGHDQAVEGGALAVALETIPDAR